MMYLARDLGQGVKWKPWCPTAGADPCFFSSSEFSEMRGGGFA